MADGDLSDASAESDVDDMEFEAVMGSLETLSRLETVSRQYFHCLGLGLGPTVSVARPRQFKTHRTHPARRCCIAASLTVAAAAAVVAAGELTFNATNESQFTNSSNIGCATSLAPSLGWQTTSFPYTGLAITRSHDSGEQSYKACGQISLKRDFSKFRHTGTIYPEAMKNGKSY